MARALSARCTILAVMILVSLGHVCVLPGEAGGLHAAWHHANEQDHETPGVHGASCEVASPARHVSEAQAVPVPGESASAAVTPVTEVPVSLRPGERPPSPPLFLLNAALLI